MTHNSITHNNVVDVAWITKEIKEALDRIEESGFTVIELPCGNVREGLLKEIQRSFPKLRITFQPGTGSSKNSWLQVDAAFTGAE